ncbi:MAG: hypothetical protein AAF633_00445 [Chloroflexota bacterium]
MATLSACFNPMARVREQAAESVAELVLEQASGSEVDLEFGDESISFSVEDENGETIEMNVEMDEDGGSYTVTENGETAELNFEIDEDGGGSYTFTDGEEVAEVNFDSDSEDGSYTITSTGNGEDESFAMDVASNEEIDTIEGMGFSLPLPSELGVGTIQTIEQNGELATVAVAFEDVVDLDFETFIEEFHPTLTDAGFGYVDMLGAEVEMPTTSEMGIYFYEHPDGHSFSIIWSEGTIILGLNGPTS